MRRWTLTFAALTAVSSVALALQVLENRRLREELVVAATARATAAGLEPGRRLSALTLRDASGQEVRVEFDGVLAGSALLIHASGCDACSRSVDSWRGAVEQAARPDVRVLCIQTDAEEGTLVDLSGLPASLAVPLPPRGWLADIPAVPATLLVDERGVLVRSWYGEVDAGTAQELAAAIAALGSNSAR